MIYREGRITSRKKVKWLKELELLVPHPWEERVMLRYADDELVPEELVFQAWRGCFIGYTEGTPYDRDESLKFAREIQMRFRSNFYGQVTKIEEPESPHGFKGLHLFLEEGQLIINLPPSANIEERKPEQGDFLLVVFGAPEKREHHVVCLRDNRILLEFGIDDSNLVIPEL